MAAAALAKSLAQSVRAMPNVLPAVPVVCRSIGGVHTGGSDVWWNPRVPIGHTSFSWTGAQDQAPPQPETASVQSQQQVQEEQKQQPQQQQQEKKPKEKKQKEKKQPAAAATPKADQPVYSRMDFRVGHVLECQAVPDSRSLVISKIDVGEAEPRQIVSGLKAFYSPEQIQGTKLIAVCNLKASPLMGNMSYGMVLCAKEGDVVELMRPPVDAAPGTPVLLEGEDYADLPKDVDINAKKKNSAWALIAPLLKTNGGLEATCEGKRMLVDGKPCLADTLKEAVIS